MSSLHYKNLPVVINNNKLLINSVELSQEVGLESTYRIDDSVSENYLCKSPYIGDLKLSYYLSGQDYLKQFIYSTENQTLSGNVAGLRFNQGYLTSYSFNVIPNSPIQVNANISFFDKITGTMGISGAQNYTGKALNLSDVSINNLSNYTTNVLTNINQINFNYSCNVSPVYKFVDSGSSPINADRVIIGERTISAEISSDNTAFNLPLSGENYGLTLTFNHPYNSSSETFGISGRINSKDLNLNSPGTHGHNIKITQNHLNKVGNISGIITGAGFFNIYSTNNTHPFTSSDGSLNYINKITIGDTVCKNFTVIRSSTFDQISGTTPLDVSNDILSIYSSNGTYIWPTILNFPYTGISITGYSQSSGSNGTVINISGSNFYKISSVNFGSGNKAAFKVISPILIQSIIPPNAITSKIQITSSSRNLYATGANLFLCEPKITSFTPVTGQWRDIITIVGNNFSGVTNVKFGNIPANSFRVVSNTIITGATPETGAGFPSGYITVYGSGGLAQSVSYYNPQVPIYNFTPKSGIPLIDSVTIYTKIDTGYLCPSGNGYKIRFGNVDTKFFISGSGALTGMIPSGAIDDYIYIYKPDGISTYNTHASGLNSIGQPRIYSFTPNILRQYTYVTPTIIGENLKYFYGKPFFFALSGGIANSVQKYTTIISNSGGAADTLQIPNVIISGGTGTYHVTIQNVAGSDLLTGAFTLLAGIDKARQCNIVINPNEIIKLDSFSTSSQFVLPQYVIDGNTDSFGAVNCGTIQSGNYFLITPKNNNLITVSSIITRMIDLPSNVMCLTSNSLNYCSPVKTGAITLYRRNDTDATAIYSTNFINLSGKILDLADHPISGIARIKIFPTGIGNSKYLGLNQIEIY